jgi:CDP-glycerol glycerophosphotransferase (TagB/SpsB family)
LLTSPELAALCDAAGWELTFLPHPNMQDYLATSPLPSNVTTLRFDEVDVQQVFAEAAAWVTDYSSLGTEAAVLECPVVYYQFDQDEFYRGRLYQQSSWSYADDGYGPLTRTQDEALTALSTIARAGLAPGYQLRMRTAVPLRDGHNCRRTVEAIRALRPSQN